jgi:predicted DNA-binding transcriptional regulator AlpA
MTFHIPTSHHIDRRAAMLAELLQGPDDMVLRTRDAAEVLGMSTQWMETARSAGYGPLFIKIGARGVGYLLGDLRKYLASRSTHQCTSEYRKRGKR